MAAVGRSAFSFDMTRDLTLRLGYHYTRAQYDDRLTEIHRPGYRARFPRALSLTRRTSLSFGVGTEATVYEGDAIQRHRQRHADARDRPLVDATRARTSAAPISWTRWRSRSRATRPRCGWAGCITRRIQFQAVASGSFGRMGFSASKNFDSYRGTVTLSTALTRFMNVGVDYAYYRYEFEHDVELEPGVRNRRSTVRAFARTSASGHPSSTSEESQMLPGKKYTPDDYVRIIWRRRWFIAIPLVVVIASATLVVSMFLPESLPRLDDDPDRAAARAGDVRASDGRRGLDERLNVIQTADPQPHAARADRPGVQSLRSASASG